MRWGWRAGVVVVAWMLLGLSGCGGGSDATTTLTFEGDSMLPTITDGAELRIDEMAYADSSPEVGDLIVFLKDSQLIVKRVVAVAGQTVEFRDCQLYVDGLPVDEPYVDREGEARRGCGGSVDRAPVPDGALWVLGDSRGRSSDSRVFGAVSLGEVKGQVIATRVAGLSTWTDL